MTDNEARQVVLDVLDRVASDGTAAYWHRQTTAALLGEMEQRMNEIERLRDLGPSINFRPEQLRRMWDRWSEDRRQRWIRCAVLVSECTMIERIVDRRMEAARN